MSDRVIFHLARYYPPRTMKPSEMAHPETLYERIRQKKKTVEYREATPYWVNRLCMHSDLVLELAANWDLRDTRPQDLTKLLNVHRAWFLTGFPKYSLPRIEAEITRLIYNPAGDGQLEIHFKAIRELLKSAQNVDHAKFCIINPIVRREM